MAYLSRKQNAIRIDPRAQVITVCSTKRQDNAMQRLSGYTDVLDTILVKICEACDKAFFDLE